MTEFFGLTADHEIDWTITIHWVLIYGLPILAFITVLISKVIAYERQISELNAHIRMQERLLNKKLNKTPLRKDKGVIIRHDLDL